jgi:F-type H+-transporting ATPase subunit b
MPQLDITTFSTQIFWLVITFGALFLVMWRVAVPRISDALEARQKRIDDNLSKAAEFKKEAEAAIAAYEESLAGARADAHSAIAEANAEIVKETAARDAELNKKLKAMLDDSEANIAKAVEDAMGNVREVAEEVAAAACDRLLGEQVDPITVTSAVGDVMKDRT